MTLNYDELFAMEPYSLDKVEKSALYDRWLSELQSHHVDNCPAYARLVGVLGNNPAVPVRLFKEYDLKSTGDDGVVKTMTSSGTTSQVKSKIYLDRETSSRQSKALSHIVGDFLGTNKRVPLLIIDTAGTVKNRNMFSARTAGIRGFSMLGRDVTYALTDDMKLDFEAVRGFANRHEGERVMIFGFTFMVWSCFVLQMEQQGLSVDLDGVLIHGGGWKKLVDQAVSSDEFNVRCRGVCGERVHVADYYGMVEQTGSIAIECEHGHLHCSILSDIEIVDPLTMKPFCHGQRGLIKTVSLLPTSYPGHILLTEDEGVVLGEDDCPCGRKGKYFKVFGRQKGAELRGCSDTYGQQ
ncbi:hypothetical protein [Adlercreutzia sp. ZJ138]|uniref:LuxE/PaaK family acyltransferase n=1 Tax=Adlercreutzia sp. ZJ138 TaxID=2709405 RepID=UPI00197D8CE9|nr:hypothetical protein [Adlercreutzia sp. ZJ138]